MRGVLVFVPLSTREIATLVWIAVFLIWALWEPRIRPALLRVLTTALHWKIVAPILAIVLYSSSVVWVLYKLGFWQSYLLKDTVVWVVVSGIALGMSGVSLKSEAPTWRGVVIEQIKIVVLVEYLVNTYTFGIWIELALIPVMTALAVLTSFASMDEKSAIVAKLGQFLQGTIGLAILWFAVLGALEEAETFTVSVALREVLLPIILSATVIPIAYLLTVISAYEQLFLFLRIREDKGASLIRYAKWRLFLRLGLRLTAVRSFLEQHRHNLLWAKSKSDIDNVLRSGTQTRSTGS